LHSLCGISESQHLTGPTGAQRPLSAAKGTGVAACFQAPEAGVQSKAKLPWSGTDVTPVTAF